MLSIFFLFFYASLCLGQIESTQLMNALSQNAKLIEPELVLEDFIQGLGTTRVIVNLSNSVAFQQNGDIKNLGFRRSFQEAVQSAQDGVISRLAPGRMSITNRFVYIFGFSAEVTPEGLRDLTEIPEVISINNDRILKPHLAQGIPLINATTVRQSYKGAGMAIAICDTGINYNHPYLGNGGFPNSKIIGGYDTGQNDANPMDGNGHGTACAGIAAGDLPPSPVGDYIGGIAPSAKLYALKITYSPTGGRAYASDMVEAWEWAVTHQNDDPNNPIMIISTSFGGGYFTSNCDAEVPAMTTAAQNAVNAGITLFVSSGNDGYCNGTAWPACITHVNSVGAVYDADIGRMPPGSGNYWCIGAQSCSKTSVSGCSTGWGCFDGTTNADLVACYSNTASFLNLLAPNRNAYTLGLGTGYTTTFGGTSAAWPLCSRCSSRFAECC